MNCFYFIVFLLFHSFGVFSIPIGCLNNKVAVQGSDGCYDLFSQGPCPDDHVLIPNIDGEVKCQSFLSEEQNKVIIEEPHDKKSSWAVPSDSRKLTTKEEKCLSEEKVFWPDDENCYSLLSQGPCSSSHWLVLEEGDNNNPIVKCKHRVCPCSPSMPFLCEVEMYPGTSDCRCKVALAAFQDGICEAGEQLLVDPYGYGECGCIQDPPHIRWTDGQCYPIHNQGPCKSNEVFTFNNNTGDPACTKQKCSHNQVNYQGGCFQLGNRGPCKDPEILNIDLDSYEPACVIEESMVKRVFNLIPNVGIRFGNVGNQFKVNRRTVFRKRKHSGVSSKSYSRRSSPASYVQWLKSYRRRSF